MPSKILKRVARSMQKRAAARRFLVRCQVWLGRPMSEQKQHLNRRQTDGDGNDALDALHAAHRAIAEHAYHLYMEGGCDRSRVAEYWFLAAQAWLDSSGDESSRLPSLRVKEAGR
jgi:hypothetical protein